MCGLTQQRQHVLRILVGNCQNRGTRLNEDLRSGQRGRFGSEVRIADRAFRFGQVGHGILQGEDIRFQGRPLEGSQSTSQLRDFVDDFVNDGGGANRVRVQRSGVSFSQLEQPPRRSTQLGRRDTPDAQPRLLVADDFATQLEDGTTARNGKADICRGTGRHRKRKIQRGGVQRNRVRLS